MPTITFEVREIRQAASGGSYVVRYNATVETSEAPGDVRVEMVSLASESDTDVAVVQSAVESVRLGATEVLAPLGLGATIRLYDFVIHPVDFSPFACRIHTRQHLAKALDPGPRETAERLANTAYDMAPEAFEEAFQRTLAATSDIEVRSRLMWVAGMYLDRHPGAFHLPRPLAEQLLNSQDFDQLLAGLKAIRHSQASFSEIVARFIAVMKRNPWEEKYAGLYQLSQILDPSCLPNETAESVWDELQAVLTHIAANAPDEHARELAARCLAKRYPS